MGRQWLLIVGLGFLLAPLFFSRGQAASGEKFDVLVYPPVWTVTSRVSGINLIAVKAKNGFSGPVTVTVNGLPSHILGRYPTGQEQSEGKGGYYCSSHCQAAPNSDFPVSLTLTDGQWTSFGPTMLAGGYGATWPTLTATVTLTVTGGGTSVSQPFTLKIINDDYQSSPGSGQTYQLATANPDAVAEINSSEFSQHLYKINLTAGQSKTTKVNIHNIQSTPVTVDLLTNLSSTGLLDTSSTITGDFDQSSISLAASETKTVGFSFTTQSSTVNGTYEILFGIKQNDGSNRAGFGISTIITGGASGATPLPTTSPTTSSPSASPTATETTSSPSPRSTPTATATTTKPSAKPTTTSALPTPSVIETPAALPNPIETVSTPFLPSEPVSVVAPVQSTRSALLEPITKELLTPVAAVGTGLALATLAGPVGTAGSVAGGASLLVSYLVGLWNTLLEVFGLRRRRYPWGTVFDVATDRPVELAIVRLTTAEGRLLETRVTDRAGRFGFLAKPGIYQLAIQKPGYALAALAQATGSRYQPVWNGKPLHVSARDTAIHVNVPLVAQASPRHWTLVRIAGILHRPVLLVTLLVSLWNYVLFPSTLALIVIIFSALLLAAELLILLPRGYGRVLDQHHRPLPGIVIRLLRANDDKPLATQVTDQSGQYSFLARPGRYHLTLADETAWQAPDWLEERRIFSVTRPDGDLLAPQIVLASRTSSKKDYQ